MSIIKEIIQELKTIDQSSRKLKQFSLIVGVLVLLVGLSIWYFNDYLILSVSLFCLGGLLIVLYWRLNYLKPIYWFWMAFATILGFVTSRLLLALIFACIITPMSVLKRCLNDKAKSTIIADSYWQEPQFYNDTKKQMEQLL